MAARGLVHIFALLVASCSSSADPQSVVEPAALEHYQDSAVIVVPRSAEAGVPFEVSVRTYTGGCVRYERIDVETSGQTVHVRPFVRHSGHDICTLDLDIQDHTVEIRLMVPGAAQVVFHGMKMPDSTAVAFSRTVQVE